MRALRWHGRGDLRLDNVDVRGDIGSHEVQIDVAYCGVCGSDIAEYLHGPAAIQDRPHVLTGQAPPITLGHEFSGVVSAVGTDVIGINIGDRVTCDATLRCQQCLPCQSGHYNHCAKGGSIGLATDGAMADRVRVPDYTVVALPESVTFESAALTEPLAVALHALDRGQLQAGNRIVIVGFGSIGAAVGEVAQALGLTCLVVEVNDERRGVAAAFGYATYAPTGDARHDARSIRELTGGGADAVLECSGSAAGLESALEITARGGRIVVVGIPKTPVTVDAARLVLFERSIVGALGYQHDLPRVVQMMAQGLLRPQRMITGSFDLQDAPATMADLAANPGGHLKVLVRVAP